MNSGWVVGPTRGFAFLRVNVPDHSDPTTNITSTEAELKQTRLFHMYSSGLIPLLQQYCRTHNLKSSGSCQLENHAPRRRGVSMHI